jgi:hypothetical protein
MPLCWSSEGHVPIVVMRTAWNDPRAAFLATKGGPASQNHGHMDSGSFVYDVNGIRWAVDLGSQSYYSIEKLGMNLWSSAQDSDRWKIFRLNNLSHNLVTIDDQLHYVKGYGKVAEFSDDPRSPLAVVDLKDVYQGQVGSYLRSFKLLPSRAAVINDHIEGVKPGAKVRWAMVTAAPEITQEGNSLVLRDGGESLMIEPLAPSQVSWKIEDMTDPPNVWDVSNKGHSLLSFTVKAPESGMINFRVSLNPQAVNQDESVK